VLIGDSAPPLPSRLFFSFRPLLLDVGALEVDPLNPSYGFGERCKPPRGVWGEALAANNFGAFSGPKNATDDI